MAKRFTDTEKWKKKFVRGLSATHKLLWFYILDDCDHSGIWHTDFDVASIRIGCSIDPDKALEVFKNHVIVFDEGEKWFLPSFIDFQYGQLNANNRANNSVIKILKKYNLIDDELNIVYGASKHLTSTLQGVKDKDKDKDKVKVKDIETRKKAFHDMVHENHLGEYETEMLDEFIDYWTEHGVNDKKMRFEKEKVFGLKRRLTTWSKNYKPKYKHKSVNFESDEMNEFKV